jgi:hypothetical protein
MNRSSRNHKDKKKSPSWSYLVANLAVLPGLGSIGANKRVGYVQIVLAIAGMAMSLYFAIWMINLLVTRYSPDQEISSISELFRWPEEKTRYGIGASGIALFGIAWIWALATSLALMRRDKTDIQ